MKIAACALALLLLAPLHGQQARRTPTLKTPSPPPPNDEANLPFKTYDTTPVMVHGPFLLEPSETTVTIEWVTDTPCTAKVVYGEGNWGQVAEPQENGLIPVGTLHRVELTGLTPGATYQYKLVSTRVVKVKGYWPDMGHALESDAYSFTTLDRAKPAIAFSVITDTHEDVGRIRALMKMVDWNHTDFLADLGDGVNWAQTEDQVFQNWLDPIAEGLGPDKPWLYARGNHDLRGPFARSLDRYLTTPDDPRYYYARDDGPVHLIVIDTGEDKPDSTPVYAGLNATAPYRQQELAWFRQHAAADARVKTAPFRIVLMHQPYWGWLDGKNKEWTDVANQGRVDLAIAGHWHRFAYFPAGAGGNHFPVLVVGQDQVARVEANATLLHVTVTGRDGKLIDAFDVHRREP